MSLIARSFEAAGLPTVILGSAMDILQAGGGSRIQFLNYPLGFSSGRFRDTQNQYQVVRDALAALDRMSQPALETLPYSWNEGWRMIEQRDQNKQDEDTRSPRDTTPRYQTDADRVLAEQLGAEPLNS